jgi:hypothetical protein
MGILSLHSSRRNETDALEHIGLLGNLLNTDNSELQRENNRLAYQCMLSAYFDQVTDAQDDGGWLILFKGHTTATVCIPVVLCNVLDFEEVRKSGMIKSGGTRFPMFNCLTEHGSLSKCDRDGSCSSAPRTIEGMWEGPGGGTHEHHGCSSKTVIPALATLRGPTGTFDQCLLDWLHAVPKGSGNNLKDGIFDVVKKNLGARGWRELNRIYADDRNRFIGSKYFRDGISNLANEQAYEVSAMTTCGFGYRVIQNFRRWNK